MNRIFRLFTFLILFSAAGVSAFADQPSSALDDKPSVDSAANAQVQIPAVPSDASASSSNTTYLYDLKKLIDKSRENIKEVNEKIKEQAVLKRNQAREERAREYYEKGVELTNEGKLDEAREYFEKAIRITEHPEMAGYIKESQRRLRKQENALQAQEQAHKNQIKEDESTRKEDVEEAYKEAVDLYKQKKYHPAKDAFEHVDEIAPGYRATDSYLKLIDQDIILADALAVKQQAIEIQRQQKEAEAARAKEKAMWLAQIEEKEKEHKEAMDKQAADVYDEAVRLYKDKKYAEAKKKFEEVSWVIPDYKATMKYLRRIDQDAEVEQERLARQQQKAQLDQRWEETVEQKKLEAQRQQELKVKGLQHQKDLEDQAQFLYTGAVALYDQKKMDEALEKFNEIEKLVPDYKDTRRYLKELGAPLPAPAAVATPPINVIASPRGEGPYAGHSQELAISERTTNSLMPPQVKVAVSLEDQIKQEQEITDLVQRSVQLYRQIADMADDSSTDQMKRKMARLEDLLNSLKEGKDRLLRRMRHDLWETQQEELKARQDQHRAEAEKMYEMAREYLSSKDYAKAKIEFLELEDLVPDYKATRRYLNRIDQYEKEAGVEVVTNYEKNESDHLRHLQEMADAQGLLRAQQEEEKQHALEQKQQAELQGYIQKASDINDDIINLARQQDYDGMKVKFTELENTVTAFMTLKYAMAQQKDRQEREKQLARESAQQRAKMLRNQKQEDQEIHAYDNGQTLKENRPVLSNQPSNVDYYKRREIMQEQNMLFSEAVDRYEHKKYSQAKLLFGELADQHDRRAEVWLKKVDHAITRELLTSEVGEERERTAFIADQVKAQRELIVIQERERQRQKKLTEELERQKRIYEDDHLLELRKEEVMKAQERERERQEAKRLKLEKEGESQQAMYRFHKIEPVVKVQPAIVQPVVKPAVTVVTPPPAASVPKAVVPPALTAQQLQAQVDYSNERKAFLDKKYKEGQREQVRQARINREKELRAEREAERQARIKAAAEAREKIKEEKQKEKEHQQELKTEEQKRKEDLLKQQAQEREEKAKQEEILREETARRQEMERQERERQTQLEAQREAVRKQLEDGVEAMYQEALSLYKQGEYTAAADKFKDVQDIIPGYKRAEEFMDEARQKSLEPQPVLNPDSSETPASTPTTSSIADPSSSPPVSRDDSVSKALDLFDSNVK